MHKALNSIFVLFIVMLIPMNNAMAVTWGVPDNGEHPNVGTLLFVQNGVGFFSCTGTMIAPRIMLTSGHCVAENGNINDITYVRFEEDALSGIGNYGSLQAWFDAEWIATETVIPHPLWNDYADFPYTNDVGLVILAEEYYPSNGFAEIPPLGFLEGLVGRNRQDFKLVGYGQQGTLAPFSMNECERYKGKVRLLEVENYLTGYGSQSAKFSNNPGLRVGACYGDSGGPVFFRKQI